MHTNLDNQNPSQQVTPGLLGARCRDCSLQELCLPLGLSQEEMERVDELVSQRKRAGRGEALYHSEDPFDAIYSVRHGFFRTDVLLEDGHSYITGFYMTGEIIGMDGISTGKYSCSAVALEDSEVCVIPYQRLETLACEVRSLQQHIHRIMSREIVRDQSMMLLLGSMSSGERLAAFLLNLSERFDARGHSPVNFHLRMTREEIGRYLGLKIETISRTFTRFQEEGLMEVRHKHVRLLDVPRLRHLIRQ